MHWEQGRIGEEGNGTMCGLGGEVDLGFRDALFGNGDDVAIPAALAGAS